MAKDKFLSKEFVRLRQKSEAKLGIFNEDISLLAPDEIPKIVHKLQTYQIEIELQNDELLRSQEQLETSHQQYIDLYDHAPVGYFSLDADKQILKVNLTMSKLLKSDRKLLEHKSFTEFIHKDDQDIFYLIYKNLISTKQRQECEIRILKKTNSWFWAKLICLPDNYCEAGNFCTRIAVIDISELKNAEKIMHAANERYRSYIEITGHLGWTTNATGEVIDDIPTWRNYTGQSKNEVMGLGWSDALHPDDIDHITELWKKSVESKKNYECEYRVRRNDGVYRHFLAKGVPVLSESGKILEWVGTCIDITDRKKSEVAINKANIELERRVVKRTFQLATRTKSLEDTNTALQVLLEKREKDKSELEKQILDQVKYLIEPTLLNLKDHSLNPEQNTLLDILETNLHEITSPFVKRLSGLEFKLTAVQIQVANMIKQGMRSKDIAKVLHISTGTVEIHRKNIRKKFGLTNKKLNLKTFLTSHL